MDDLVRSTWESSYGYETFLKGQSLTTISTKKLTWLHILKIKQLDCMLFIFLTHVSNFVLV